jgi:hypothetical protein
MDNTAADIPIPPANAPPRSVSLAAPRRRANTTGTAPYEGKAAPKGVFVRSPFTHNQNDSSDSDDDNKSGDVSGSPPNAARYPLQPVEQRKLRAYQERRRRRSIYTLPATEMTQTQVDPADPADAEDSFLEIRIDNPNELRMSQSLPESPVTMAPLIPSMAASQPGSPSLPLQQQQMYPTPVPSYTTLPLPRIHLEPSDDDMTSDSDDDALSIFEETAAADERSSGAQAEIDEHFTLSWRVTRIWLWRLFKTLILVALPLISGFMCSQFHSTQCTLYGAPWLKYAILIAIILSSWFLAKLTVLVLIVVIRHLPAIGPQFLYYVRNVQNPLVWSLISLVVYIAWPVVFINTPLYNNEVRSIFFKA